MLRHYHLQLPRLVFVRLEDDKAPCQRDDAEESQGACLHLIYERRCRDMRALPPLVPFSLHFSPISYGDLIAHTPLSLLPPSLSL